MRKLSPFFRYDLYTFKPLFDTKCVADCERKFRALQQIQHGVGVEPAISSFQRFADQNSHKAISYEHT